jgi:hypothetical protein
MFKSGPAAATMGRSKKRPGPRDDDLPGLVDDDEFGTVEVDPKLQKKSTAMKFRTKIDNTQIQRNRTIEINNNYKRQ